ncbi:GGDEF domain-containing protein [Desulfovibrio litoralis]|uniref:Diguanylate cyclase (GGDEF) domain-containing protein n=1 Tax=Desulfovibrio litoralis DSM 11393 TaxID=1121455 RepID=A0A1M7S7I8_9BACT|nr:GGDEF domain-containing protein [Desulfovibrio litoralis]SHN54345.1 diguanylate cyclase (GGDEF) domain-containing protein [Desulfovibrio litoralis DSM 11393]
MDKKNNHHTMGKAPFSISKSETVSSSCVDNTLGLDLANLAQAMRETIGLKNNSGDASIQNFVKQRKNILAIFHLVDHLDLEDWYDLVKQHDLSGWLALELSSPTNYSLKAMLDSIEGQIYSKSVDPTTGLANNTVFIRELSHELQRASRAGTEMSLALIEIDDPAQPSTIKINEIYRKFAEHCIAQLRNYETAARLDENRFAIILPASSAIKAQIMIGRLLSNFREEVFRPTDSHPISFTFSAGIATYGGRLTVPTVEEAICMADLPLRTAQLKGGNTIILSNVKPDTHSDRATLVHSNEKQFLFSGIE